MKKNKFTFVDFFIVVAVLAVAVVAFLVLKSGNSNNGELSKVNFTMLATRQDEGISELIKPGDDVIISFSEEVHATVVEAYEKDRVEYYFNNFTGKYVSGKVPGKSDVYVKLTANAKVSDTAITVDGLDIRVGDEMPVSGKGYVAKGYVVEVEEE